MASFKFITALASVTCTTALLAQAALAAPASTGESSVTKSMHTQLVRIGGTDGAFCYATEDEPIQGYNVDKPVKIASVMKLLTTFWAVETRGANARFETTVYVQRANKEMHIVGSRDPYFDRIRLGLLIADLNKLGIKEMNRVTADQSFRIDYDALDFLQYKGYAETTAHAGTSLAARNIKEKLQYGFNTADWSKSDKQHYVNIARQSASPKLPAGVVFKADSVDVVANNPLEGKPGVEVYTFKSAPLKMYLREMNILSANAMADEMFASLGGIPGFQRFMASKFGATFNFGGVNSGSGLPVYSNKVRKDTEVTCRTVVSLVRRLDHDLEAQHLDLASVMMIMGKDKQGTMKDGSEALIAKTGTVNGGKNLAGVEETTKGEIYFGIFLQGRSASKPNIRTALTKFMTNFRPVRVKDPALNFHPLDTDMQLKIGVASQISPEAAPKAEPRTSVAPVLVPTVPVLLRRL